MSSGQTSGAASAAAVVKRILVATDFSPAAHLAVWRAGQLARQHDAHLHVVHAQPDWNMLAGSVHAGVENYRAVAAQVEHSLGEELAFLQAKFGVRARGETRIGRASQVLRTAIAEIQPHIVVAGARGEHDTPAMAPFLGGTALKLIAFAGAPVLLVRKPGAVPYAVAVAAVERSSESARMLVAWVGALLGEGDCHIVHAFDVPYADRLRRHGVTEATINSCTDDIRAVAKTFVDEVLDCSSGSKQRLHAHLVRGEAVATLLAEIGRLQPDLVVVGKHQHPPREHLTNTLGSVAMRVAYHAPGDVLVVP